METLAVDYLLLAASGLSGTLGTLWSALCVVLGLGLVIFFHELGHFAVAKWCDVHVERFSIGFGPILWSRQKGETEYALSAIPFGGYVKMLGQDDMDASKTANEDIAQNPRSYSAKKVWQRMAIISAGVIMNILTAAIFYTIAFAAGVRTAPPTVGPVMTGSPAWEQGIELGDQITHVNGESVESFPDISMAVALSTGEVELRGTHADGEEFDIELTPDDTGRTRVIGVGSIPDVRVITFASEDPVTMPGLPAEKADPPFLPGDRIRKVAGQDVANFVQMKEILVKERRNAVDFELQRINDDGSDGEVVTTTVEPLAFRSLGVQMEIGKISSIKADSPAAKAGMQVGDTIRSINGKQVGSDIDPLRLPQHLCDLAGSGPVEIVVRRQAEGSGDGDETLSVSPLPEPGWRSTPNYLHEPFAAESIGVAYFVTTRIAAVQPGSEAETLGIKAGAIVTKVEFATKDSSKNEALDLATEEDGKEVNWALVYWNAQRVRDRNIVLHLREGDKTFARTLEGLEEEKDLFMPVRGFHPEDLQVQLKASGFGDAFRMGVKETWKNILQIYLTLRGLFVGDISPKELQGPVGIAKVGYAVAREGLPKLMLFLGFLSVNLAVLNFLPIPVLDGGHMVFLIYEAVAGKKPSEKVLVLAQYAGLILILGLMVFVLGQDFYRLFSQSG